MKRTLRSIRQVWRNLKNGVSLYGDFAVVRFRGKWLVLKGANDDVWEVFGEQRYSSLHVKGKTVHDVGASVADTAIYFMLNGAKQVLAYEMDSQRVKKGEGNLLFNNVSGVTFINAEARRLSDIKAKEGDVLKMDIEGGEYGLFGDAAADELQKFPEIIMEFHKGSGKLERKLQEAGFEVKIVHRGFPYKEAGILHAKKSK